MTYFFFRYISFFFKFLTIAPFDKFSSDKKIFSRIVKALKGQKFCGEKCNTCRLSLENVRLLKSLLTKKLKSKLFPDTIWNSIIQKWRRWKGDLQKSNDQKNKKVKKVPQGWNNRPPRFFMDIALTFNRSWRN